MSQSNWTADELARHKAVMKKLREIRHFMPHDQDRVLKSHLLQCDERKAYYQIIENLHRTIAEMPHSYQTEGQGDDAVIHLHYFTPSWDFYITEKDMGDSDDEIPGAQWQAYGYRRMNSEKFGYICIEEMLPHELTQLDFHWTPKTIGEIKGREKPPVDLPPENPVVILEAQDNSEDRSIPDNILKLFT